MRKRQAQLQDRYEKLHILSEILLGIWFLVGSIMFFYKTWVYWGTWLFVIGSAQMLVGPTIRLIHRIHLKSFLKKISHLDI